MARPNYFRNYAQKEKEIKKRGVGVGEDTDIDTTITDPALQAQQKALQEQNYKAYYNQRIQQSLLNERANKYLQNELANQGLSSQGYGSSAQTGLNTNLMNAYSVGEQAYAQRGQEIEQGLLQQQQETNLAEDEQLLTFIGQSAGDQALIDKYLQNYGYKDEKGEFTEKWNTLDPNRKATIQSVIDTNLGSKQDATGNFVDISSPNNNITYYSGDGSVKSGSIKDHFKDEIGQINTMLSVNELPQNTSIMLKNIYGEEVYVKFTGGKLVYVPKKDFDQKNSISIDGRDMAIEKYGEVVMDENGKPTYTMPFTLKNKLLDAQKQGKTFVEYGFGREYVFKDGKWYEMVGKN